MLICLLKVFSAHFFIFLILFPLSAAHVGVGLAGVEGGQAVQNADFALSQFRFLQRLLLVHGRWSYRRISLFLCYFLFKTCSFALVQIWFAFFNGFSAQVSLTLMIWAGFKANCMTPLSLFCSLCMRRGSSLFTLCSIQRYQFCLWPSLNRWVFLQNHLNIWRVAACINLFFYIF